MIQPVKKKTGASVARSVLLPAAVDRAWVEEQKSIFLKPSGDLVIDFSATRNIDSAGVAFLRMLNVLCKHHKCLLRLKNVTDEHLAQLQRYAEESRPEAKGKRVSFFLTIGDTAVNGFRQVTEALSVLVEMVYWGTIGSFKQHDIRKGAVGEQMYLLGYKAIIIVGLLSFLIGMVLSLQTALQLRTYGAGIFLAPLIGITMVREMGPLLTAIILAGRTGSATTAEIATMAVNEEIDALKTMGINPIQFIVVPKFWAISITMPMLSIIATTTGILGGYLIAVMYLDLSSELFFGELTKFLTFKDIRAGFIKSIVFSWLIVWIGSFYGLRVRGGAEAVGKETTGSVVTGIFIIIIADALFSFVL